MQSLYVRVAKCLCYPILNVVVVAVVEREDDDALGTLFFVNEEYMDLS